MAGFYLQHKNAKQVLVIFMNIIFQPAISILNYAPVMKLIITETKMISVKVIINFIKECDSNCYKCTGVSTYCT